MIVETYIVAVFGTLKKGLPNHKHYLEGKSTFLGRARSQDKMIMYEDFPIAVVNEGTLNSPEGKHCVFELYRVDVPTLQEIDRLEGWNGVRKETGYNRVESRFINTDLKDVGAVKAFCYLSFQLNPMLEGMSEETDNYGNTEVGPYDEEVLEKLNKRDQIMGEKFLVAVYGTLKSPFGNHRIIRDGGGRLVCRGRTIGKFLMTKGGGFPYMLMKKTPNGLTTFEQGTRCNVEIYEIDRPTLQRCDMLESYVEGGRNNHYERIETSFLNTDVFNPDSETPYETVKAFIYVRPYELGIEGESGLNMARFTDNWNNTAVGSFDKEVLEAYENKLLSEKKEFDAMLSLVQDALEKLKNN